MQDVVLKHQSHASFGFGTLSCNRPRENVIPRFSAEAPTRRGHKRVSQPSYPSFGYSKIVNREALGS